MTARATSTSCATSTRTHGWRPTSRASAGCRSTRRRPARRPPRNPASPTGTPSFTAPSPDKGGSRAGGGRPVQLARPPGRDGRGRGRRLAARASSARWRRPRGPEPRSARRRTSAGIGMPAAAHADGDVGARAWPSCAARCTGPAEFSRPGHDASGRWSSASHGRPRAEVAYLRAPASWSATPVAGPAAPTGAGRALGAAPRARQRPGPARGACAPWWALPPQPARHRSAAVAAAVARLRGGRRRSARSDAVLH